MSKNERYGCGHRKLRNAATAGNDAANWLAQQFGEKIRSR